MLKTLLNQTSMNCNRRRDSASLGVKKKGYKMNLEMTMEMHLEMEPDCSLGNDEVVFGRPCAKCETNCECGSPCGCLFDAGTYFHGNNAGMNSNSSIREVA